MSSSIDVAKEAAQGTVVLFIGNFLSTVIVALTSIITARLLGPDAFGLYTLALVIPNILYLVVGLGVGHSITRFSAYYLAKGEREVATRFAKNALIFLFLFGLTLTVITLVLSSYLGTVFLHRQGLETYIEISSLSILGQTILLSTVAGLVGYNSMGWASVWLIVQSLLKLVLVVGLILLGLSVYGALLGYFGSFIVSGIAGTLVFYFMYLRSKSKQPLNFLSDLKEMLVYGVPLYFGNLTYGIAIQIMTIFVAAIANNTTIGLYQAAANVSLAISIMSTALASSLGRSFSSLDGSKANTSLAFTCASKYISYLYTPLFFFIFATSSEIMNFLYGNSYVQGAQYLQLLALSYFPVAIGQPVLGSYFSGISKSKFGMYFQTSAALIIFVSAPVFVYIFASGVNGLIYSLALSNLLSTILGLYLARKYDECSGGLKIHSEFALRNA